MFMSISLFFSALITMVRSTSTSDFFPEVKGNLTKISWAHAVNNKTYLENTLKDDSILMMEADVVMGKLNNQGDRIPIMGHPPATVSDLSLEQFLNLTDEHNLESNHKKGVKLDFKSIEVFLSSLDTVNQLYEKVDYPIWINADIVKGPVNATTVPVDPEEFLKKALKFERAVLSIGWTTKLDISEQNACYSKEQIDEMLDHIKKNNIKQEVTFPVRAGIAANSLDEMKRLVRSTPNSTLTIWSSEGDPVDVENLRSLIRDMTIEMVYLDVPESLRNQLHLNDL